MSTLTDPHYANCITFIIIIILTFYVVVAAVNIIKSFRVLVSSARHQSFRACHHLAHKLAKFLSFIHFNGTLKLPTTVTSSKWKSLWGRLFFRSYVFFAILTYYILLLFYILGNDKFPIRAHILSYQQHLVSYFLRMSFSLSLNEWMTEWISEIEWKPFTKNDSLTISIGWRSSWNVASQIGLYFCNYLIILWLDAGDIRLNRMNTGCSVLNAKDVKNYYNHPIIGDVYPRSPEIPNFGTWSQQALWNST